MSSEASGASQTPESAEQATGIVEPRPTEGPDEAPSHEPSESGTSEISTVSPRVPRRPRGGGLNATAAGLLGALIGVVGTLAGTYVQIESQKSAAQQERYRVACNGILTAANNYRFAITNIKISIDASAGTTASGKDLREVVAEKEKRLGDMEKLIEKADRAEDELSTAESLGYLSAPWEIVRLADDFHVQASYAKGLFVAAASANQVHAVITAANTANPDLALPSVDNGDALQQDGDKRYSTAMATYAHIIVKCQQQVGE